MNGEASEAIKVFSSMPIASGLPKRAAIIHLIFFIEYGNSISPHYLIKGI
jgi:hypothetical protein